LLKKAHLKLPYQYFFYLIKTKRKWKEFCNWNVFWEHECWEKFLVFSQRWREILKKNSYKEALCRCKIIWTLHCNYNNRPFLKRSKMGGKIKSKSDVINWESTNINSRTFSPFTSNKNDIRRQLTLDALKGFFQKI
jgi:hypothetical protein